MTIVQVNLLYDVYCVCSASRLKSSSIHTVPSLWWSNHFKYMHKLWPCKIQWWTCLRTLSCIVQDKTVHRFQFQTNYHLAYPNWWVHGPSNLCTNQRNKTYHNNQLVQWYTCHICVSIPSCSSSEAGVINIPIQSDCRELDFPSSCWIGPTCCLDDTPQYIYTVTHRQYVIFTLIQQKLKITSARLCKVDLHHAYRPVTMVISMPQGQGKSIH